MKNKELTTKKYPSISIVTPSYNQGKFIRHTIDSILDQNYPNLEYIVIDGGSTDETISILKSYGKRIRWESKKTKGQTDAINQGIRKTKGEIVAYLNSDDIYLPNSLFTIGRYFMNHPEAQWVTGDYYITDAIGNKIQSYIATYKTWLRKFPSKNVLSVANYIIQPSTFWRRSAMEKIGDFDESLRYCMDLDYWFKLIEHYPPHILPDHFSMFRIHGESKGGSQFRNQFAEEIKVVNRYQNNILLRFLHWIHVQLTVFVYSLIKHAK